MADDLEKMATIIPFSISMPLYIIALQLFYREMKYISKPLKSGLRAIKRMEQKWHYASYKSQHHDILCAPNFSWYSKQSLCERAQSHRGWEIIWTKAEASQLSQLRMSFTSLVPDDPGADHGCYSPKPKLKEQPQGSLP